LSDPWHKLRRYTQARIAQGNVGCSLPTSTLLDFQLAHAAARDAVHQPWDVNRFEAGIKSSGLKLSAWRHKSLVESNICSGRKKRCLDRASRQVLYSRHNEQIYVVVIIINGLSSAAMDSHGLSVSERPEFSAADSLGAYMTTRRGLVIPIPSGTAFRIFGHQMSFPHAAVIKLDYLSYQALQRGYSCVVLKDDMPNHLLD